MNLKTNFYLEEILVTVQDYLKDIKLINKRGDHDLAKMWPASVFYTEQWKCLGPNVLT